MNALVLLGLMAAALTPEMGDAPELHYDWVRTGVVRVHTRPIKYVDETGNLRRIAVDMSRDGTKLSESRNVLQFEADSETRSCWYRVGQNGAKLTLASRASESALGVALSVVDAAKPVQLKRARDQARWTGALGTGVFIDYEIENGRVKENIVFGECPDLAGAETYCVVWNWTATGLTPALENGAVLWKTADGAVPMAMPAPAAWDAAGVAIAAEYRLDGTSLAVVVDAAALAGASYPVVIDPTVDTSDASDSCYIYDNATADVATKLFVEIPALPDLGGATVTAATFKIYGYATETSGSFDVYADATSAWSSASSYSALNSLSFNTSTSSGTSSTNNTYDGFSVLGGTTTGGVLKYYTDSETGVLTVMFEYTGGSATPDSKSTSNPLRVGEYDWDQCKWDNHSQTNAPHISLTYNAAAAGRTSRAAGGALGLQE